VPLNCSKAVEQPARDAGTMCVTCCAAGRQVLAVMFNCGDGRTKKSLGDAKHSRALVLAAALLMLLQATLVASRSANRF
jgi:hypothetical protein